MKRDTLRDFFDDRVQSTSAFLIYDNGIRSRAFTYDDTRRSALAFAGSLRTAGLGKDDTVLFWGENRPEWVMAFWGCVLEGVVVVPLDYRASTDLVERVMRIVNARAVVVGDEVRLPPLDPGILIWRLAELVEPPARPLRAGEGGTWPAQPPREQTSHVTGDDLAEIIFTSGATADPKGVIITHRNILANIVPVEREVVKYRKYGRPFFPLRFLNLLPLSHMFGQAMATFIPPMLPGVVVFMHGYNPNEIVRQLRMRRVSVLVCVPKILDVLREHIFRLFPAVGEAPSETPHIIVRWWRYRKVHRLLGWKFWCFVVGAAPLDPALEEFWSRLGFLVVQGYGLTEAAPIVTLNHPFKARKGTVGTPIAGVEIKIAPDGEILVRGENVTSGYYQANHETAEAFADGWFRTGDIGALDDTGRLIVRGRKKEVIVTPEGLNVFPEDVERAINGVSGVRDSAVVGVAVRGEERVHAVLVLEPGIEPGEVVRQANARLESHQGIRGLSLWSAGELPRTEGTKKLKRREIKRWVEAGASRAMTGAPAPRDTVEAIVGRFAGSRAVTGDTTLDELGLSSLERMELMLTLEERLETSIDEMSFAGAATIGDLRTLIERPVGADAAAAATPPTFPVWNRGRIARVIRRVSLATWILPLGRLFTWIHVEGRTHLDSVEGPVLLAANHQSHLDVPVILAALPARRRYKVAAAMAKEFFEVHFHPERHTRREWLTNSLNYYLAALFFNAFPMPQREAGTRQTLRYIGELLNDGLSVLIFPEGRRSDTGEIDRFLPGIGMIASRLNVPVVPVRLEGIQRVLHHTWRMARPGPVRVVFGPPLYLEGDDFTALAKRVEDAVRSLPTTSG